MNIIRMKRSESLRGDGNTNVDGNVNSVFVWIKIKQFIISKTNKNNEAVKNSLNGSELHATPVGGSNTLPDILETWGFWNCYGELW